jgi:hypothetical protein
MVELKKDDVGTTADGLGKDMETDSRSRNDESGIANSSASHDDSATASSKGSIMSGSGDEDLTQAGGGSVD